MVDAGGLAAQPSKGGGFPTQQDPFQAAKERSGQAAKAQAVVGKIKGRVEGQRPGGTGGSGGGASLPSAGEVQTVGEIESSRQADIQSARDKFNIQRKQSQTQEERRLASLEFGRQIREANLQSARKKVGSGILVSAEVPSVQVQTERTQIKRTPQQLTPQTVLSTLVGVAGGQKIAEEVLLKKFEVGNLGGIPKTDIGVVDKEGKFVRVATSKESQFFRSREKQSVIGTKEDPLVLQFKDIDFKGTFTGKGDISRQAQTFVEQRLQRIFSKAGDKTLKAIAPFIPERTKTALKTKVPFSYVNQLKFLFFSPALTRGVTKKGTAKVKVKTKPKVTIKDISQAFEKEFKKGNTQFINERLRKLTKLIEGQTNPELKRVGVENLRRLLTDLNKKNIIGDFVIDQSTGKFAVQTTSAQTIVTIDVSDVIKTLSAPELRQLPSIVQLGGTAESIFTGTGKFEQTKFFATQKPGGLTGISLSGGLITKTGVKDSLALGLGLKSQQKLQLEQKIKELTKLKQPQRERELLKLGFGQTSLSRQKELQKELQKQRLKQRQKTGQGFKLSTTATGILPPIPTTLTGGKRERIKEKLRERLRGFHVEVRERGKFKRITKKPVIKRQAKGLGSFAVDNSTAVTFRIQQAKGRIKEIRQKRFARNKFRDFQIRKGRKVPLKNTFIELKKNRIDTRGEINQLSLAKLRRTKSFKQIFTKRRSKK